MQILFINLSTMQLLIIASITLFIVVLAILKVIKRESGLPQILWVLSIIFIPPFLAMIYLFNAMIINKQIKLKS